MNIFSDDLVDLHIHTQFSDGTDSLEELLDNLRKANIKIFAITDHDTSEGATKMKSLVPDDMIFIPGCEFSSITPVRKLHLLGLNFDETTDEMKAIFKEGREKRVDKFQRRINFVREKHGIEFSEDTLNRLLSIKSVGKPHIADEIVKMGLATDRSDAIKRFITGCKLNSDRIDAEKIIPAVHKSGGLAIWAHPLGGENERHLTEEEFLQQLEYLIEIGLDGFECWYSRYNEEEVNMLLKNADKYNMLVSGGSDYHGKGKNISLGELNDFDRKVHAINLTVLKSIIN